MAIFLRSMTAHWPQLDSLHGNERGRADTHRRAEAAARQPSSATSCPLNCEYYLDHLNLSNKFDKDMALTNNLLVNLDELDAIHPSQHASLKQTLSKNKVNGRPIFGRSQDDSSSLRPRLWRRPTILIR